jgi:hypothetical protein
MRVPVDENTIIKIDKIAAERREKHPDHQPEQQQAKEDYLPGLNFPSGLECGFQNRKDAKQGFRSCPFSSKEGETRRTGLQIRRDFIPNVRNT